MSAKDFNRPGFLLAAGFFLAGLGQFFIGQADKPYTFWLGIFFYALGLIPAFKFFSSSQTPLVDSTELSVFQEALAFFLILGLGLFLRVYGIHQYPDGIFADRAEVANGAIRILQGQRPFLDALQFHVPEIPIYYLAAGWFALWGSDPKSYAVFDAALSLAGIVLAYGFFRQATLRPRIALLAFFFLAVMRFNFAFAHQVYFQSQSVLFLGLTLVFLLAALRKNRPALALVSGAALAAGLYAYQACKAIPLLVLALWAFEFFADTDREAFKKKTRVWIFLAASFFCFAAPYFYSVAQTGELGRRDAEVSILTSIRETGSLKPLAVNLGEEALMFNRLADNNTQSDFDRHRMLDDGMGILFVLGFFYALTRLKERVYFLAAAGTVVMCLPSALSISGGHAGRSLGCTPFVALTCALFLDAVLQRWEALNPGRFSRRGIVGLVCLFLGFIVWQNFHDYFQVQAKNPVCQNDCSWTETRVGELIASGPGTTDYFLPSRFYGHPTVQYLTQGKADQIHPLDVSNLPKPVDKGRGFCFLLEDSKAGTADFLSHEYPGSRVETLANPLGETTLYEIWVSSASLARLKPGAPKVWRGLQGVYAHANDPSEKPFLIRRDPLINFSFRDLPGTGSPLFIHWRGQLMAPTPGNYDFLVITNGLGQARLLIDGRGAKDFAVNPPGRVELAGGRHSIDLYFEQGPTALATLHFLWKKPGSARYEFVPNGAFGKVTNFSVVP